jgi:CheY-like chemotaxis protein
MDQVRVLVVDDERNARMALCELLRDEGYEVAMAGDGMEAMERVATFQPQVVLSDVKMPRMNGVELRDALAASAPVPVVVLMSAHPLGEGILLRKPIELPELYEAVAIASERARAA